MTVQVKELKNALVTGASHGIGRAICEKLVEEGFFVYCNYHEASEEEISEIENELKNVKFFKVDFSKRQQTIEFIEKLEGIQFHAIVNNAGTFLQEDFNDFDMQQWDHVIEVNLNTPLLICTKLHSAIVDGGAIVNISSTDGYTGSYSSMSYSASKAALSNLTKSLANNFARRNIRVNSICPGWINTGMSTDASYKATYLTPLGRNGKPIEIANTVSFLLSDKASFITGSNIFVDGGYTNVDSIMKEEAGLIRLSFDQE